MPDTLFVPPPGAMQFELLPKFAALVDKPVYWVVPILEVPSFSNHDCRWFEIVDEDETLKRQGRNMGWTVIGRKAAVCLHHGKIIE